MISEPFVTNANFTSIDAPEDVDEWIGSGLSREASVSMVMCSRCLELIVKQTMVRPPRVKESGFSMECEVSSLHRRDEGALSEI